MSYATTWMNLNSRMLSEGGQPQNVIHMWFLFKAFLKGQNCSNRENRKVVSGHRWVEGVWTQRYFFECWNCSEFGDGGCLSKCMISFLFPKKRWILLCVNFTEFKNNVKKKSPKPLCLLNSPQITQLVSYWSSIQMDTTSICGSRSTSWNLT